ncbi:hypothetical protein [Streptomyces gobiensis]|uniref:hypothetical protein n=1 Tax=Streptomyces gobiensis TaxID=2875706 RepID=UPI001E38529D|nr:hypothetical protein [Streptomyces gobiensis]UGY91092.1 hypothetical protein test1122_04705 [Streptomyces gobiensis]
MCQLVDVAADTGDVAGDGRGDAVAVVSRALAILTQDEGSAVGVELAVAARRVAADEVPEQDEVGRSPRELMKSQECEASACDCLWLGFCWRMKPWRRSAEKGRRMAF